MRRICIISDESGILGDVMEQTKVTKEDLLKIKEFIENVRFGSVTVIVHDGKVIQIEKNEKVRLNS